MHNKGLFKPLPHLITSRLLFGYTHVVPAGFRLAMMLGQLGRKAPYARPQWSAWQASHAVYLLSNYMSALSDV